MKSARILLIVFTLSISLVQLIELGHSVLHAVENPIHYHKIRKVKDFKAHSLADHHFQKMKFAHEMDEPAAPSNFIVLAFGFVEPLKNYLPTHLVWAQNHNTRLVDLEYLFFLSPPVPPPPAGSLIIAP